MMAIPDSVGIGPLFKRKHSQSNPRKVSGIVQTDEHGEFTVIYANGGWIRVRLVRRKG